MGSVGFARCAGVHCFGGAGALATACGWAASSAELSSSSDEDFVLALFAPGASGSSSSLVSLSSDALDSSTFRFTPLTFGDAALCFCGKGASGRDESSSLVSLLSDEDFGAGGVSAGFALDLLLLLLCGVGTVTFFTLLSAGGASSSSESATYSWLKFVAFDAVALVLGALEVVVLF